MTVVATVNTKGGTGKTTTSIHLANEYTIRGRKVTLVDLDKQGSASSWADRASDKGTPLPFKVEVSNRRRLDRLISAAGDHHVIVVDTPPGDSDIIEAAISVADFVVIPTQPSGLDIERVWETVPALKDQQLYAVLITGARLGTTLLADTKTVFDENGISRFDTIITAREKYRQSVGHRPSHDSAYSDVIAEMSAVQ